MQSEASKVRTDTEEKAEKMLRGYEMQAMKAVADKDSAIAQM